MPDIPDINEVISLINSPSLQNALLPFKIVFILITVFFSISIIWFLYKTSYLKIALLWDLFEFLTQRPYGVIKMNKKWNEIVSLIESGGEREYRLAIIEAGEILNNIFKKRGVQGKTLEEKLNQMKTNSFPPVTQIMEAQKICKDPNHQLTFEEAKEALKAYREAFEYLKSL